MAFERDCDGRARGCGLALALSFDAPPVTVCRDDDEGRTCETKDGCCGSVECIFAAVEEADDDDDDDDDDVDDADEADAEGANDDEDGLLRAKPASPSPRNCFK